MNDILEAISELLIETAAEPDGHPAKRAVERLVPDDSFVFLNQQPATDGSPPEEEPTIATLRRNANRRKEAE